MGERDDYKFLEIRDAIASINQKVSLIGVVIEYGFPKKTKGTDKKAGLMAATSVGSSLMKISMKVSEDCDLAVKDWFCTIRIVDASYQKGLSVNVFAEHIGALPHVASFGDIVQLSHVMMKTHGGEVYAVFNKRYSAFALHEESGEDFLPYQTYPKFRSRDVDKKFIAGLREWFVDFRIDEDSDKFSLFREVKECKSIDLACKEFGKDEWIAFVWDGTDTQPNKLPMRLEDEKDNPLPLHLEPSYVSRDKFINFPSAGSVLRVVFDQVIKRQGIQLLKVNMGKWMKLINVHCEIRAGLWCGVLTPLTKVRYTPKNDLLVLERQRLYSGRLGLRSGRNPYWSFPSTSTVTDVDFKEATTVTLMDALTYPEVTAKFRCTVRVVAAYPWQAKDFCSPHGVYRVRLTLEDPTARIHAYLYADDAENFFGGHPPVDELTRKRNALLGVAMSDDGTEIENTARNPPWVQCCIKSYYLRKDDQWGSRHFRIFGTKLVG